MTGFTWDWSTVAEVLPAPGATGTYTYELAVTVNTASNPTRVIDPAALDDPGPPTGARPRLTDPRGGGLRPAAELVDLVLHVEQPGLGRVGARLGLAGPIVQVAHAPGDTLDEVVDVTRVVAAPTCLTELDGVERLRSQFHAQESNENSTPSGGQALDALLSTPAVRGR